MSGSNGDRVEAVAQYLSHGAPHREATARNLVANLQDELEKPRPDLTLVGTYLGLASRTPVTSNLVEDVSASLCAPVTGSAAQQIAEVAEAQREKLRADRRTARRSQ
jgi:IMP cyclohydrolase